MIVCQAAWLAGKIWIGATPGWRGKMLLLVLSVVGGLVLALLPETWISRFKDIGNMLSPKARLTVLCFLIFGIGVFYVRSHRMDTDEARIFTASKRFAGEGAGPFLYEYARTPALHRLHPPLATLIYGGVMRPEGPHLGTSRMISLFFSLGVFLLTYGIGTRLYDSATGFLAALALLSFPYFLRVGAIALTDMPAAFFSTITLFLLIHLFRTEDYWIALLAGFSFGLSLLTKYTIVLLYPAVLSWFAMSGSLKKLRIHLALFCLVSAGFLAAWIGYLHRAGVLSTHLEGIGFWTRHVTTFPEGRHFLSKSLLFSLPYAVGPYNLPLIFLGSSRLVNEAASSDWFTMWWAVPMAVALFLMLPEPRYFLPILPAVAIAVARGLRNLSGARDKALLLALAYSAVSSFLSVIFHPLSS